MERMCAIREPLMSERERRLMRVEWQAVGGIVTSIKTVVKF
jgi:hypothetical protein